MFWNFVIMYLIVDLILLIMFGTRLDPLIWKLVTSSTGIHYYYYSFIISFPMVFLSFLQISLFGYWNFLLYYCASPIHLFFFFTFCSIFRDISSTLSSNPLIKIFNLSYFSFSRSLFCSSHLFLTSFKVFSSLDHSCVFRIAFLYLLWTLSFML